MIVECLQMRRNIHRVTEGRMNEQTERVIGIYHLPSPLARNKSQQVDTYGRIYSLSYWLTIAAIYWTYSCSADWFLHSTCLCWFCPPYTLSHFQDSKLWHRLVSMCWECWFLSQGVIATISIVVNRLPQNYSHIIVKFRSWSFAKVNKWQIR